MSIQPKTTKHTLRRAELSYCLQNMAVQYGNHNLCGINSKKITVLGLGKKLAQIHSQVVWMDYHMLNFIQKMLTEITGECGFI